MLDPITKDALEVALNSLEMVIERFEQIDTAEEFVSTNQGMTLMDSIAMRLQTVGENFKKIEEKSPGLLLNAGVDPKQIIRFRDKISHHYDEIDHQILFSICESHVPNLHSKISRILGGQTSLNF